MNRRPLRLAQVCALLSAMTMGTVAGGCTSLSPQLRPTDFEELETSSDRQQREQAYADNAIYRHEEPQGMRYTKGTSELATKRSWQSLDAILRSDASASAALPTRNLRISRVFTALTVVAGILTVAGTAASAREGLDLQQINGTGAVLLGGGLATVGFGITAGVFYGKTRKGYEKAVDVYNDSLAVRLGLSTPTGEYIPPAGTIVDEHGYVVLDERERGVVDGAPEEPGPAPEPEPEPELELAAPSPEAPTPEPPPAEATPEPAPAPPTQSPKVLVPDAPPSSTGGATGRGGAAAPPLSEPGLMGGALDLRPR
ncbi:hypothetical protein [Paraliomyxa miuraensis]|uniref:hypothetical protein n=1 Tax=Paraliomyxa miuraensis TaxID=376150 RepID=UPI002257D386|nr:hypothetical protein [Paraliomyxa miuraensis]MCX4241064.1 hypothetical protein [Paraliomyxa miuraensis]